MSTNQRLIELASNCERLQVHYQGGSSHPDRGMGSSNAKHWELAISANVIVIEDRARMYGFNVVWNGNNPVFMKDGAEYHSPYRDMP